MLVSAPKDNLAPTFPSRVAAAIEPSGGGARNLFSFDILPEVRRILRRVRAIKGSKQGSDRWGEVGPSALLVWLPGQCSNPSVWNASWLIQPESVGYWSIARGRTSVSLWV